MTPISLLSYKHYLADTFEYNCKPSGNDEFHEELTMCLMVCGTRIRFTGQLNELQILKMKNSISSN
jgi:hypothetical protein